MPCFNLQCEMQTQSGFEVSMISFLAADASELAEVIIRGSTLLLDLPQTLGSQFVLTEAFPGTHKLFFCFYKL